MAAFKPLIRKAVAQQQAIDQTGKQATEFSLKFATDSQDRPDFKTYAAEQRLAVKETAYVMGPDDLRELKAPAQFAAEILKLSVGGDVIYVAHWVDTQESTVPTFEQVKAKVAEIWKRDAGVKLARETGRNARAQFAQLLADGKSSDQAAKALSLSLQSLPPFSLRDIAQEDPNRYYKHARRHRR
jgi:hypothetical protein